MCKAQKKARLSAVVDRLAARYPDAACSLSYGGEAWKLLVMGRLSAQCTDARVNIVCKELFAKYPTAAALSEAPLSEIERIVAPCGLYRMKAKNIRDACARLVTEYGGVLPDSMEALLTFPGVGRKIANLLLGDVFGKPALVCDTHCIRICGRLGMYPESLKNPTRIETILRELIDPDAGSDFCHRLVLFGRDVCSARAPACTSCPLADLCAHAQNKRRGEMPHG